MKLPWLHPFYWCFKRKLPVLNPQGCRQRLPRSYQSIAKVLNRKTGLCAADLAAQLDRDITMWKPHWALRSHYSIGISDNQKRGIGLLHRLDNLGSRPNGNPRFRRRDSEQSEGAKPSVDDSSADAVTKQTPRPATDDEVHMEITDVYSEAKQQGFKAPNVLEIGPTVKHRLRKRGVLVSASRVTQLAKDLRHEFQRLRVGEKRRGLRDFKEFKDYKIST